MPTYLILADSEQIRILRRQSGDQLVDFDRFVHPMCQRTQSDTQYRATEHWLQRAEQHCYIARLVAVYLHEVRHSGETGPFIVAAPAQLLLLLQTVLDDEAPWLFPVVAENLMDRDVVELTTDYRFAQ